MGSGSPPNPWATPATASAAISGATSTLSFDVTADVRAFLDGSKPNFGWIIKANGLDPDFPIVLGARESGKPPHLRIVTRCKSAFADCDHDPANGCEQSLGTADACGACGVSCDDHNPCTADSCGPSGCQHDPVGDGVSCDDGDACTGGDVCHAGVCTGAPVACSGGDACHAAGVCDPSTGTCANAPLADGTTCSDGNACTQGDSCQAGVCTAGAPLVCGGGDPVPCGGDVRSDERRVRQRARSPTGRRAATADACTQGDSCQAGVCTAGTPVVCGGGDACHAAGVCDPIERRVRERAARRWNPVHRRRRLHRRRSLQPRRLPGRHAGRLRGHRRLPPGRLRHRTGACSNVAACQLYGIGAISGTAMDGLAVTPGRLEDGTPNNQIGGIGSAIAYTGVGQPVRRDARSRAQRGRRQLHRTLLPDRRRARERPGHADRARRVRARQGRRTGHLHRPRHRVRRDQLAREPPPRLRGRARRPAGDVLRLRRVRPVPVRVRRRRPPPPRAQPCPTSS